MGRLTITRFHRVCAALTLLFFNLSQPASAHPGNRIATMRVQAGLESAGQAELEQALGKPGRAKQWLYFAGAAALGTAIGIWLGNKYLPKAFERFDEWLMSAEAPEPPRFANARLPTDIPPQPDASAAGLEQGRLTIAGAEGVIRAIFEEAAALHLTGGITAMIEPQVEDLDPSLQHFEQRFSPAQVETLLESFRRMAKSTAAWGLADPAVSGVELEEKRLQIVGGLLGESDKELLEYVRATVAYDATARRLSVTLYPTAGLEQQPAVAEPSLVGGFAPETVATAPVVRPASAEELAQLAEASVGEQKPEAGVAGQPTGTVPGLGGLVDRRPDGSIVVHVPPEGSQVVGPEVLFKEVQGSLAALRRVAVDMPRGVANQTIWVLDGDEAAQAAPALAGLGVNFFALPKTQAVQQALIDDFDIPSGKVIDRAEVERAGGVTSWLDALGGLAGSPVVVHTLDGLRYQLWQRGLNLPELAPVLAAYDQAAAGLEQYFASLA